MWSTLRAVLMEGLDWDVADLYCSCDGLGVSSDLGTRRGHGDGGVGGKGDWTYVDDNGNLFLPRRHQVDCSFTTKSVSKRVRLPWRGMLEKKIKRKTYRW